MSEKLTLEWCFKYPNAKIIYDSKVWEVYSIHMTEDITIIRHIQYDVLVPQDYKTFTKEVSISDCKLILRPLSSLTDEENKNLVMMLGDIDGNGNETLSVPAWDIYSDDIITMDYHRSICIDIDNLQKRGIAVYE